MSNQKGNDVQFIGKAVPIYGDDIDTDRIVPARFLKEVTFEKMGEYLFRDSRFNEADQPKVHPLNEMRFIDASIMIVNRNFGCGSSREHAPQSIKRAGFKALIGESFSEIFRSNCTALGVPIVTGTAAQIREFQQIVERDPDTVLIIDLADQHVLIEGRTIPIQIASTVRESFMTGMWDIVGLLNKNEKQVKKVAGGLAY